MRPLGKGLDIVTVAGDLLQCVIDHYDAATLGSVAPLPARRAIVPGGPREAAWDCEQITVALEGIGYGQAVDLASQSQRSGTPVSVTALRHAVLVLQLVRCTPEPKADGTGPSVADLDAAGRVFLRDAGMLSQATVAFASRVRGQLDSTESVQTGTVDPVGPTGGYHAVETTLAITVAELV